MNNNWPDNWVQPTPNLYLDLTAERCLENALACEQNSNNSIYESSPSLRHVLALRMAMDWWLELAVAKEDRQRRRKA